MEEQNEITQDIVLENKPSSVFRIFRRLLPAGDFAGNLFIVGAQKAGTSALYSYLVKHPRIAGGDRKELHFFDREKGRGIIYGQRKFLIIQKRCYEMRHGIQFTIIKEVEK